MNIADSFYVALCMTVLLLGVVYWFWTQTQYLQRKINLLENIVYELKTLVDHGGPSATGPTLSGPIEKEPVHAPVYPPAPGSELGEDEDLLHETLMGESDAPATVPPVTAAPSVSASVSASVSDDLQPGGVGSGLPESVLPSSDAQKPRGNVLDGMTLKELRRLAEQRNIAGASGMRKQSLIEALRAEKPDLGSRVEEEKEPVSSLDIKIGLVAPFEEPVLELA
jgi:hypothetical protein